MSYCQESFKRKSNIRFRLYPLAHQFWLDLEDLQSRHCVTPTHAPVDLQDPARCPECVSATRAIEPSQKELFHCCVLLFHFLLGYVGFLLPRCGSGLTVSANTINGPGYVVKRCPITFLLRNLLHQKSLILELPTYISWA